MTEMKKLGLRLRAGIRLYRRIAAGWFQSLSLAQKLAPIGVLVGVIVAFLSRKWIGHLWSGIPPRIGSFFLHFSQNHPHLSRILHVGMNVIPDVEFLVLALAGLVYLMPSFIDRIEKRRALRIGVMFAFVTFGALTVVVNAINREEENYTKAQLGGTISDQGKKLDSVNTTNEKILQNLVSNKTMTEAERRENIEKVLRNEYITSNDAIDPQILAGNQMPPSDWMNRRLASLGEHWKVAEPKPIVPIIQEAPKPELAKLIFTLWDSNASLEKPVLSQTIAPDADGNYPVDYTFGDLSETTAEMIDFWIEICSVCKFAKEPEEFQKTDGTSEQVRHRMENAVNPGTNVPKMTILVKAPPSALFVVGFHYSCKTCGKMAPHQIATIYEQNYSSPLRLMPPPQ